MKTHSPRNRGFSLVELFITVLLIVAMAAFAISTPTSVFQGSRLSQAERILTDQIKLARQEALTRNHPVEVRFIRYGDPETPGERAGGPSTGFYRAIQVLEVLDNESVVPLDKPRMLPQGIIMSSGEHSTLLSHMDLQPPKPASGTTSGDGSGGDPSLPRGIDWNYDYIAFRFQPDGGTNLNSTNGVIWCTTLHHFKHQPNGANLPKNFVTLQLDPVAGSVQLLRPSL